MSYKVFVVTSDHYLSALKGFAYLFNKYWGPEQQVIVCGYKAPDFDLPGNFTFFSLGMMSEYPIDKWSNALMTFLWHFPKEQQFVLMLEDYWIAEPVRKDVVKMALDYLCQFRGTLKFDLGADRRYAWGATPYSTLGDIPLVKSDPNSQYHMSLWGGAWNREMLLKVLVPNWTPWEVELAGTPHVASYGDEVTVVGCVCDPWPMRHVDVYRAHNPHTLILDGLSEEDRAELKERGFV